MEMLFSIQHAGPFNEDIGDWDVGNVTNMRNLFHNNFRFDQENIRKWNIKNVTNTEGLFCTLPLIMDNFKPTKHLFDHCMHRFGIPVELRVIVKSYFSPPALNNQTLRVAVKLWINNTAAAMRLLGHISDWNTSFVTNMDNLFEGSGFSSFHLPNYDLNDWNVSNVTSMRKMFHGHCGFNSPIDQWDVSRVRDMNEMFSGAVRFNQPIGRWNVRNVTSMHEMFYYSPFNQPLKDWDVSNVTVMSGMFQQCKNFNQALKDWDVSNVEDMSCMFQSCQTFNQPLEDWDVRNVMDMSKMFKESKAFNQPLGRWRICKVERMDQMFNDAAEFNQPLNDWNVSTVVDMRGMFRQCPRFDQPLNKWKVSALRFVQDMFEGSPMKTSKNGNIMKEWEKKNDLLEYEHYEKFVVYQEGPLEYIRIVRKRDKKGMTKEDLVGIPLNEHVDFDWDNSDDDDGW
jgi:hypothetical protein